MRKAGPPLLAAFLIVAMFIGAMPVLFALACATSAPARAGGLSDVERRNASLMLEGVRKTIEPRYYDPSFKGHDLNALADVARERIGKAGNIAEALAAIAQFELELDDLHTTFTPPWLTVAVDYGWKMGMVGDICYVIALDPRSDAARQGVAIGDRVVSVNGFVPTRSSLWRLEYLFNDLHPLPGLHVELTSPAGVTRTLDLAAKVHPQRTFLDLSLGSDGMDRQRFEQDEEKYWMQLKPVTVRSMPDVLLVRMPSFLLTAHEVQRQFRDMRERAALILDLRGNGGGAEEALDELLGELYGDDLALATRQMRGRSTAWVVKGAGKNAYTGRVLVLVDAQSASASELFARALQLTDRGTVIGDQTMGAVMEALHVPLAIPNGENVIAYGTSVTIADIVMSDGGRLEKVGVTPDFVVLPSAADLNTGRDPALAQALSFVGHPMDAAEAARLYGNR
jgi:C-terminal processing protease CtpA/Prc